MEKDKIESLLGFAVKAGKTVYGVDGLEATRAHIHVVLVCSSASDNTKKKAGQWASKRRIPVIIAEKELQYTVGRKNCKVLGISDKQMAQAMLAHVNESYHTDGSEVK